MLTLDPSPHAAAPGGRPTATVQLRVDPAAGRVWVQQPHWAEGEKEWPRKLSKAWVASGLRLYLGVFPGFDVVSVTRQ